ncbi:GDP-mannose 4,6-dehydratase [Candidatus Gottesmanbacteria bacterium RIFCSPHIGHO2_02_FULL_40_24]|uniref:GDP-mannose 4,6-dehydratase n=1 Tax=Candidatus Gottesmanbacteria bacterium RIFCSPHIGHO2_01_FULL_40_15 TaxID=1798376 RepID=A0A1F5Z245_9BACT|nr:MAG: GDP-mannose 4,6-dehydratase [Candidatus Gottesmanbacteria bacterium RIFCSPHIGHO2_01_FULL_40_15]OGG16123.1 MAG: GDP-mannose 4,6-dehydratase [Candidatus Gottesmanbacteria bacterium RIFCSPHIGHO2_02_FULL_40_24]OGG20866.1 MAG: GDP-mannose 4,6-dehydratase [Candidatus Gottesmanbacteria bacterium RIFCSPLOWO2_01_FULL_40_10]OGG25793.1 MAG: GDP-mannose 4,6-dehydratase [Candidatus Gottesmanbacteria bacterium RIFCSPHIGHO2_12_FULL_40_13]OGG32339.1 MAG: GDP-mannose 4,6-dehydratase [Candidatus Gottesma
MKNAKKKALITGITGFAGSHLAELLIKENVEVHGILRWRSKTDNIETIKHKINLYEADLLDAHSLYTVVDNIRPNFIFHLAAQSYVQTSWSSPSNTLEINVVGTVNIFEAVRKTGLPIAIQIACSSEEYGRVHPSELPIKENNPLRPLSPYAVSKLAMDYLGYQYWESYQMRIIRTRGFNHTGPRRGDVFAESTFARQIAEIEKGKKKPVVLVGNLNARRDYTDVRDMVRAYYLSVQKCKSGQVYNISTGKSWRIGDVLDLLIKKSNKKIRIIQDKARLRPSDVEVLVGDASKFKKETGWKPVIPFEKTMEDLLNYWRQRS